MNRFRCLYEHINKNNSFITSSKPQYLLVTVHYIPACVWDVVKHLAVMVPFPQLNSDMDDEQTKQIEAKQLCLQCEEGGPPNILSFNLPSHTQQPLRNICKSPRMPQGTVWKLCTEQMSKIPSSSESLHSWHLDTSLIRQWLQTPHCTSQTLSGLACRHSAHLPPRDYACFVCKLGLFHLVSPISTTRPGTK